MNVKNSLPLQTLQLFGRLWVIGTSVIGTLVVWGFLFLFVMLRSSSDQVTEPSLNQKTLRQNGPDKIAVVNLNGPIFDTDAGPFSGSDAAISAQRVTHLLEKLQNADDVKAVILKINSPGGAVVASDEIYQQVRLLQQHKVVVASLGDVAASGGYYIASGANKIVANPASITGSIGVIAQLPQLSGLYEKIGVEMRTIKSGEFKDIGSESRDTTAEEQAIFDSIIKDSYDQFIQAIVTGRKMDEASVRKLADGRIYSGKQAKANGLVDELGDFQTTIKITEDLARISNATLVEYSDQSFFESLLSSKFSNLSGLKVFEKMIPTQQFGIYYLLQI